MQHRQWTLDEFAAAKEPFSVSSSPNQNSQVRTPGTPHHHEQQGHLVSKGPRGQSVAVGCLPLGWEK
jgi:hypothetical protein